MCWCFSLHKFQSDTQIFQNCHGSLLEVAFPIKRLERLWQEKRKMCEDRKTTSSILFCDVQTADAFKESILDGSGFEYLCKHPRIASFPTWPSSCSKSVQVRLESGCFSFFLAWWFGYGCSLEGEKDSPNSLKWTPINQYQQQSWYILIYITTKIFNKCPAKGFSSVLHISGACSHCSHCHLSAVYPSTLLHIGLRAPPQRWAGQLHRPMSPPHPSPSRWARNKVFGCWKCQGSKASRVIQGWMITICNDDSDIHMIILISRISQSNHLQLMVMG